MSIFGVKKKRVDTSEIEKEIENINSSLRTMNTLDNTLSIRVLNMENIVSNIKNIPDRKIISIDAGIEGVIRVKQYFSFGDGGGYYVMSYPGQILGMSLTSLKFNNDDVAVLVRVNNRVQKLGINLGSGTYNFSNFGKPLKVEAGDKISFVSNSNNSSCINTLVSAIIELFIT